MVTSRFGAVMFVSSSVFFLGCPAPATDTLPPSVTLAASTSLISLASSLTLTAAAADDQGVTRVAIYDGESKLVDLTTAPFEHTVALAAVNNGTHRYSARASDAAGNEGSSNEVSVVVDIDVTPPNVTLEASSAAVSVASTVTLTATASDNKGIAKVEFFRGNTRLSEDLDSPYVHELAFALGDNGAHSYTAKAYDTAGQEAISAPVTVVVAITPPPQPPVATLSFGLKALRFTWPAVGGAASYQLFEDVDGPGVGAFVQVGADVTGTTVDRGLSLHRTNPQAKYHLRACNAAGCSSPSNELGIGGALLASIGYVKASDTASSQFGDVLVLSADGNTMVVGSRSNAVYVFVRGPTGWAQQARLSGSNTESGDEFGQALALSDDGMTLAVGAYGEDSAAVGTIGDPTDNSAPSAGAVYIFRRSGTAWSQQAALKASNTQTADYFGLSVSLSSDGNTLAVGASGEDSAATGVNGDETNNTVDHCGAAYVFQRTGVSWQQQAYLKASNPGAQDRFGGQLSLSGNGNLLAVAGFYESSSAPGLNGDQNDNAATRSGAVYVFTRNTTWLQTAYVKASNPGANDNFGSGLALSRDGLTLAVGSPGEDSAATGINGATDEDASDSGAVYVFHWTGTTWAQQAMIKASNTGSPDAFGHWLSLSSDGSLLAVGAPFESSMGMGVGATQSDDSANQAGAAYVFSRSGVWRQQSYVKASNTDPAASTRFGDGLSLSGDGDTLAVGASRERSAATGIGGDQLDTSTPNAGAVYLY
jgi:hypothetical protein